MSEKKRKSSRKLALPHTIMTTCHRQLCHSKTKSFHVTDPVICMVCTSYTALFNFHSSVHYVLWWCSKVCICYFLCQDWATSSDERICFSGSPSLCFITMILPGIVLLFYTVLHTWLINWFDFTCIGTPSAIETFSTFHFLPLPTLLLLGQFKHGWKCIYSHRPTYDSSKNTC